MFEIQSKLKSMGGWLDSDIKRPFYVFIVAIVYCFLVLGFKIIRNWDNGGYLNPIIHRPLDFNFILYILSIILGSLIIIKLIRYYFEFHSKEYLMYALFLFGTVVNIFLWHMTDEYFSNLAFLNETGDFVGAFRASAFELAIAARPIYWFGTLFLFIYVVRLRNWNNYNFGEKVLIFTVFFDQICRIVMDLFMFLFMAVDPTSGVPYFWTITLGTGMSYLGTISGFVGRIELFNPYLIALTHPIYIVYIFLVYNLLRSPQRGKSKTMTVSRFYWILFASVTIFFVILQQIPDIGPETSGFQTRGFFTFIQLIFMIGLLIILYYGPEVILITDKVLFASAKLHSVIEKANLSESESLSSFSEFTNYKPRLKSYIDSIPSNQLEELIESKKAILKSNN